VHYNSDKPAQLQAHAYAQGTDIHLASGQEKHLPHEAWHVVQQKQGRVKPTTVQRVKIQDTTAWKNYLDNQVINWDKRLKKGTGLGTTERAKNEHILWTALNVNGRTTTRDDVIDFAITCSVEIPTATITNSSRPKGYVYSNDFNNLIATQDIERVIRGAGDDRTAPNQQGIFHHHCGNVNRNLIYKYVNNVVYVLGYFGHHMTTNNMNVNSGWQTIVDNIASRSGFTKVVRYGNSNNDTVVKMDW